LFPATSVPILFDYAHLSRDSAYKEERDFSFGEAALLVMFVTSNALFGFGFATTSSPAKGAARRRPENAHRNLYRIRLP
jgi:hypothetical protein